MGKIKKLLNKLKSNLILWAIVPLCLIAPDFITKIFTPHNQVMLSEKFIAGLYGFSLFLSFAPRYFIFILLGFFISLELIQFSHLFYYNSFITANKFDLLFAEYDEVFEAAKEAVNYLFLVPIVVLIPYFFIIFLLNKFENKRYKSFFAIIPIIAILSIIPNRVREHYNGFNYYPDPADHSLRNSLYAFTNFALNQLTLTKIETSNYHDYVIQENDFASKNLNIVLIIGESVNPRYMSLFDYQKNTTPFLSNLKNDPNFFFTKAISAGVNTTVSVPLLLNGIYEPNNYKALDKRTTNLFKLAKKHNFKNFYISAQSGSLLSNVDSEFIDKTIFKNKAPLLFSLNQDEALLKIAQDLQYSEKNFIVLHKRNIHAPYEDNYKHNPKYKDLAVDRSSYQKMLLSTYENAILYEDEIIYNIIDFYSNKFNSPTYIFFTPDHGEGLGFDNIFGHSDLKSEIYNILFLAYLAHDNLGVKEEINRIKAPFCHYDIHNLIAKLIGFDIINPNLKPNSCFVQGSKLYGNNEFVEVKKPN